MGSPQLPRCVTMTVLRKGIHGVLDGRFFAQHAVVAHDVLFPQNILAGERQKLFERAAL